MIVKVQRSIRTSDGRMRVLIYNEDRSIVHEDQMPEEILAMMGTRLKVYFNAHIEDDEVVLDEIVADQDW